LRQIALLIECVSDTHNRYSHFSAMSKRLFFAWLKTLYFLKLYKYFVSTIKFSLNTFNVGADSGHGNARQYLEYRAFQVGCPRICNEFL